MKHDNEDYQRYWDWLDGLLKIPSVSPQDCGAQNYILALAQSFGVPIEVQYCNRGQTSNIALTLGLTPDTPHCHFIGHTDVVPAFSQYWSVPPYALTRDKGLLYGRGTCDMKGAIIAFLAAYQRRLVYNPQAVASLLLTSDEEGAGTDGLQHLLRLYPKERVSLALIGEPTAKETTGDRVKNGRRGSLHGSLLLQGQSCHVAYPHRRDPLSFLKDLLHTWEQTDWDGGQGGTHSRTAFQVTKIQTQECVENVIPGSLELRFNFRYIAATACQDLQQRFIASLDPLPLNYCVSWRYGAKPWHSSLSQEAIWALVGQEPVLCSGGGVSDGYKVAQELTDAIVEVGLPHKTAHQEDEHITEDDFKDLIALYERILLHLGS